MSMDLRNTHRITHWLGWILVIALMSGCTVSDEDIRQYGADRDWDKLIRYIRKNHADPELTTRVKLAITEVLELGYNWEQLRDLFYSDFDSVLVRHSLLVNNTFVDLSFLQTKISYFMHTEREADHQDALALTEKAIQVGLEPVDSLRVIRSTIEKLLLLGRMSDSLLTEKEQLEYQYESLQGKVDEMEGWLKQNTPVQLYGYIRAQKEEGVYEITVDQSSAILITTDTRFETTGYFQIWANEVADNMPVTLREEYGGLTEKWQLYREVPAIELNTRFELTTEKKIQLEQTFLKMWSLKGEPEAIGRELEKIQAQRETLRERATDICLIEIW